MPRRQVYPDHVTARLPAGEIEGIDAAAAASGLNRQSWICRSIRRALDSHARAQCRARE